MDSIVLPFKIDPALIEGVIVTVWSCCLVAVILITVPMSWGHVMSHKRILEGKLSEAEEWLWHTKYSAKIIVPYYVLYLTYPYHYF